MCVGEIWVDCFSERSNLPLTAKTRWTQLPGGPSANLACGLVKLGTAAAFMGAVGKDRWGTALTTLMQDMGVEARGIQSHPLPTREVFVRLDASGQQTFVGFSQPQPDGFADAHLMAEALDLTLFEHCRYLVLGATGLAYPETGHAMERCLQQVYNTHCRVVMTISWQPMFWPQPTVAADRIRAVLPQVSFLTLGVEESEWLFETADPAHIAQQNPQLVGVLITLKGGCHYWLRGHQGTVTGFPVDVEDTTGADDAFVAGFLHQLCKQGISGLQNRTTAHQIVTYACAVGALTTTRSGAIAAQPTPQEVDAFLYLNARR